MAKMPDRHEYCTGGFTPDDIVISGVSGRFPSCDSVGKLCEALLAKKNLLEQNNVRFEKGADNLPFSSSGTINGLDKLDAEFFGFAPSTADAMDPAQRLILEVSYEAIADSGYDPSTDIRGTNIGVYTAITNQDAKEIVIDSDGFKTQHAAGYLRCMFSNRCSHAFDLHGPSFTVDTACSSSFVALWSAFLDLQEGRVDAALVNAVQLCLSPQVTNFYVLSGIVSPTATSDPFDIKANGIVRTEAATALFIQKASVARRAYATILNIKHAAAGYIPEGVYVPSHEQETKLFKDVLQMSGLTADDIDYVEGHGTGTPVGDPIEVRSIEKAFCENRTKPLYLGSVKSNLGHSEAAAGHCGAIKVILAFETGIISPNQGFETPNPKCEAIVNGSIRVVTNPTPLMSPYVPVSSFGFGGSIVHTILKRNPIEYPSNPERQSVLPRLVLYPATTEPAVQSLFDYIEDQPELRDEFFALLNKLSFTPTPQKPFRGYALYQNEHPVMHIKNSLRDKRQVWFVLNGMGCQWPGMGLEMMKIEVFADSMKKSAAVLKPLDIDLFELLRKDTKHLMTDRSIRPAFVAIAAIQIALVDVLRVLEIQPDGIIGHSVGELICAYADGCCTAEQAILSAYWRGRSVESVITADGAMAAVGLTLEEAARRCPKDVYPACHNAEDSVTISGLKEAVEIFVAQLQKENIFARVVNAHGYAFHCKLIWPAAEILRNTLSKVFPEPRPRTSRWISTSYPEEEWQKEDCKMACAEYFVHNLMSTVRFNDGLKKIPSDAITIEIGPHFLLQSILKRVIGSGGSYIGLMKRNDNNNIGFFLESIGKLYVEGLDPKIENLYPPVKFPVPRNTPMISDLIQWNHSQSWHVKKWKPSSSSYVHRFHTEAADSYLLDHFIDGRSLFPATGYVFLAWQALAKKLEKKADEMNIVIEDFKIHRATLLSPTTTASFDITIFSASGSFEIMEGNSLVASGKVNEADAIVFSEPDPTVAEDNPTPVSGEDIYNELKIFGYEYGPSFKRLVESNLNGTVGFVEWNNWISFMDALLLFYMFTNDESNFVLPTGALSFKISPSILKKGVEQCRSKNLPGVLVNFHANSRICRSIGVEIESLDVDVVSQHAKSDASILEEYKFVPYAHKYTSSDSEKKLEKYMVACNKVIEKIEKHSKIDVNTGKFIIRNKMYFDTEYVNDILEEQKLFSTLQQFAESVNEFDMNKRMELFSNFETEIGKDISNTILVNEDCLRIMFDIISENSNRKLSVLEVNHNFPTILPTVIEVVEKYSAIKFKNKTLVCRNENDIDNDIIKVRNIQLLSYDRFSSIVGDKNHGVVISSFCTGTEQEAQQLIHLLSSAIEDRGFVLLFHKNFISRPENLVASLVSETINVVSENILEKIFEAESLSIISKISDCLGGNLYLLRHTAPVKPGKLINISGNVKWIEELKSSVIGSSETTWLLSEDCPVSGVIGMVNCLRHEPGGDKIRCVFIPERSKTKHMPTFSFSDPFYKTLLNMDLVMNVFKDGSWGSFRHVRLGKEMQSVEVDYSYVDIKKYGDLSSFQWMESAVKYIDIPDDSFIHIYYSALNFRDVMLASGKISIQTARTIAGSDNCVLGLECSGRNRKGQRIAGICKSRGLATATQLIPEITFLVPDEWSLEDAATVPVVYTTCYYAMMMRGQLRRGESVLIHSGTGGIGLAAINIALSMNCEVFTTVGTTEKRQYIMKTFPALKEENIGNSRNTTFKNMIMKRTKGRGVDLVLNSLADDKFYASIRCVAKHGRFIEIGKYDLSMDNKIGLKIFLDNITFHGVFLDQLFEDFDNVHGLFVELHRLVSEGIRNGVVKPLNHTVFQRSEAERAFRYMGSGTHIGKVMLKIRDEEKAKLVIPEPLRISAVPGTYFYSNKVYIVIGGLGGFGIEVSKWILSKGAKNLVLTSRFGARTPYHHLCLKRWKDKGNNVIISIRDASIKAEAEKLLKEVAKLGPIGGIFNSAVVLHDAFLENLKIKNFKDVCAPKADATQHLDTLSRFLCPQLDHFVCFSSISCGRGNAGQMNYGYANSVMERICEQRRAENLPGLAIQWGIIGEVGVVHRHMGDDAMIAGVGAQRVKSCLDILDLSCQLGRPVVSSYVMKDNLSKRGGQRDVLQQLARIFGLKDVSEFNTVRSFGEMGVDSMIGIEIKHLMENTCDISLTMKELQEMRLDDVKMLLDSMEIKKKGDSLSTGMVSTACISLPKPFVHTCPIEPLNTVKFGPPVFILDLDCNDLSQLRVLGEAIGYPTYAMLWTKNSPTSNAEALASWYLEKLKETAGQGAHIIAISSASITAFEMILQTQMSGKNIRSLTVLNGSSSLVKVASKEHVTKASEVAILCEFVENYIPSMRNKLKDQLSQATNFDEQVRVVVDLFTKSSTEAVNKPELTELITLHVKKVLQHEEYRPKSKLQQDLLVVEDSTKLLANDVAEVKLVLSEVCSGKVTIQRIPGIENFTEDSVRRLIPVLKSIF